jgi:hypothetical protein
MSDRKMSLPLFREQKIPDRETAIWLITKVPPSNQEDRFDHGGL